MLRRQFDQERRLEHYDLVVIGCGPAGEKGAAQAAYYGKSVLVAERAPHPGGAMVHTGTLASKTLRESALAISGLREKNFGVHLGLGRMPSIDELSFRRISVAGEESERIQANMQRHQVEIVRADASFEDPHTIRLSSPRFERVVQADKVLIATGSRPSRPPLFPFIRPEICDSDEIVILERVPQSMVVVGAGVIGCEYASIFASLGIRVILVDGRDRALPFLDREVGERLTHELQKIGVEFLFNEEVSACRVVADWRVELDFRSGRMIPTECVLVAAGRESNTERLHIEKAGIVAGKRGLVTVNENFQTSQPHIYAAGDVIGHPALASTSMEQARVAVCHAFALKFKLHVGSLLPYGIYTIPECSYVGATEEELVKQGTPYVVGRTEFELNARGRIMGETGFVKLLVQADDRRILGAHIVCERASELIHAAQAHMMHGATLDVFIEQVFNYPTLGEAFKYATYDALAALERRDAERGAA
jgi:NAD(P) transhydrogenase